MNRRRFLTLAAPSIIGISGIIQLSRPRLVFAPSEKAYWEVTFDEPFTYNMPAGFLAFPIAPGGKIISIPVPMGYHEDPYALVDLYPPAAPFKKQKI